MENEYFEIVARLLAALFAGGLIGLERSRHGRSAGFREHTLVCMASSLLMLITLYKGQGIAGITADVVRTDATRVMQGIMTGIGFLGAGGIIKEGLSVRGLTTAASIWMTAAIGIMIGVGFYFPALAAALLTFSTLSVLRLMEKKMATEFYAQHHVRFPRDAIISEPHLRALIEEHGFAISNLSYSLIG
ncbi:MAG: MgtC/SapB family protein, partial [Gammaproteobacteria bacterium]